MGRDASKKGKKKAEHKFMPGVMNTFPK